VHIFYDNDKAGREGSYRIADAITPLDIPINIYYFPDGLKKGYDVGDFILDGNTLEDLFKLQYEQYDPRQQSIKVNESDYEVERELLQTVLNNNKFLTDLMNENIRVSDFKDWRFQEIYKRIIFFVTDKHGVRYCDIELLKRELHDRNLQDALNEIIGASEIRTVEEFFSHIKKVQLSSYKFLFDKVMNQLIMLQQSSSKSIEEIQGKTLNIMNKLVSEASYNDKISSMNDILDDLEENFNNNEDLRYISSFDGELNIILGDGFRVGKVHIISGEVSLGKSIFVRQQAEHASKNKVPTLVFITEAQKEEVAENTMSARTDINNYCFKTRKLKEDIHELRDKTRYETDKEYLFYCEAFSLTWTEIINTIRVQIRKRNIKHVIIDQLTSIKTEGKIDRKTFVTNCMLDLVSLANDENICIIVVSQLKADSQGNKSNGSLFKSGKPESHSLAESSDLARLAYTIIILKSKESEPNNVKAWAAKNRNGKCGLPANLTPENEYSRFKTRLIDSKYFGDN